MPTNRRVSDRVADEMAAAASYSKRLKDKAAQPKPVPIKGTPAHHPRQGANGLRASNSTAYRTF